MFNPFRRKSNQRKRVENTKARLLMSIEPDGETYLKPEVLYSLNVSGAEKFLGKKLNFHITDKEIT